MEKNLNVIGKTFYLLLVAGGLVWLAFLCFSSLPIIGALFLFVPLAVIGLMLANSLLIAAAMLIAVPVAAIMTGLTKIISRRRVTGA